MLTVKDHALRKTGITGSEIWDLVCGDKLSLWAKKVGLIDSHETTYPMRRGTALEAGMRHLYREETGYMVDEVGTMVHPDDPLIICTPDGVVYRRDTEPPFAALEIKVPTPQTYNEWGESHTDQIPIMYVGQTLFEAAVLGVRETQVCADLGTRLGIYEVPFDAEAFGSLQDLVHKFWRDYVLTKKAPEPSGSPDDMDTVRRLTPFAKYDGHIRAEGELLTLVGEYRKARDARETAEKHEDRLKGELMLHIDDHAGLIGDFGRIDYKNNKPSSKTNWQAICMELHASDELIKKHTESKPGARVFKPYWRK
jgi:hypothetical protein